PCMHRFARDLALAVHALARLLRNAYLRGNRRKLRKRRLDPMPPWTDMFDQGRGRERAEQNRARRHEPRTDLQRQSAANSTHSAPPVLLAVATLWSPRQVPARTRQHHGSRHMRAFIAAGINRGQLVGPTETFCNRRRLVAHTPHNGLRPAGPTTRTVR